MPKNKRFDPTKVREYVDPKTGKDVSLFRGKRLTYEQEVIYERYTNKDMFGPSAVEKEYVKGPRKKHARSYFYTFRGKKLNTWQSREFKQWQKAQLKEEALKTKPKKYKAKIPEGIEQSKFSSNLKYNKTNGRPKDWVKPMTKNFYEKGRQVEYAKDWRVHSYKNAQGKLRYTVSPFGKGKTNNKQLWKPIKSQKGAVSGVFTSFTQLTRHFDICAYQIGVQADNFRIMLGHRAQKVFQESFTKQKLNTRGSEKWQALSEYTIKKRKRRGTDGKILKEYGDLHDSIKVEENVGPKTTRVYTDVVPINENHKKYHSICYAGYHNEGEGHYGHTQKAYIKRQFMGHSTFLSKDTDPWIRKMMSTYLFDAVFMTV